MKECRNNRKNCGIKNIIFSISKRYARFRKWSRKAYAAFSSMHLQVSIGHVNKWITDLSLAKSITCCTSGHASVQMYGCSLPSAYDDRNGLSDDGYLYDTIILSDILKSNYVNVCRQYNTAGYCSKCIYNIFITTNYRFCVGPEYGHRQIRTGGAGWINVFSHV